jgi:hypothetical protein
MFYSIFTVELYCHHRTTPLRARRFAWVSPLVDGCIPSDMATGKSAQIDEERRLFYVAMTRAKEHLYLIQPLRFFRTQQHRFGDGHAHRSALALFAGRRNDAVYPDGRIDCTLASDDPGLQAPVSIDIGAQLCGMELNASRPRSCPASTQKPRFKVAHPLVALQGKNLRDGRNASLNPGNAALRASPVCNER